MTTRIDVHQIAGDLGAQTTFLVPVTVSTPAGPALLWDDDDNLVTVEEPR